MAAEIRLPDKREVRDLLAGLLGDDLRASESAAPKPSPDDAVSVYVDDQGAVVAVAIATRRLAVAAGAAIAVIPSDVVEEVLAEGGLPANFRDNFREVMNVLAALLCDEETPHVRFREIAAERGKVPADGQSLLDGPRARLDLEVEIAGYGKGHLSIGVR